MRNVTPPRGQPPGLTTAEAFAALRRYGPNRIAPRSATPAFLTWVRRIVTDPMAVLLFVAAGAYAAVGDRADAIVLGIALLPIVLVGVVLEGRADSALARLRDLSAPRARVIRDGSEVDVPAEEVVPGGSLVLTEGDIVAADGEVLKGVVNIDESALTGESLPVERAFGGDAKISAGTTVVGGHAIAKSSPRSALTEIGRFIRLFVTAVSLVVIGLVQPCAALAQIPGGLLPGALTTSGDELPPGIHRVGNVEIAIVTFENRALFAVTGPVVHNRQNPGNLTPVDVRATQIQENLQQVLSVDPDRSVSLFGAYDTFYDPRTFRVSVKKVDGQPVLIAGDREHPNDLTLLTVTAGDARYNTIDGDDLAQRWQRQLQAVLVEALDSRQPQLVRRHLALVPRLVGAIILFSIALWLTWRRLRARRADLAGSVESASEPDRARIERRLELNSVFLWMTLFVLVAIWLVGLLWILALFPATAVAAESIWTQLLWLVLIWFLAGLLDRLANAFINRFAGAWTKSPFLPRDDASRRPLRIPTIVRVVEGFKAVVIYLVAVGVSFNVLGLSTVSVLTIGAAVAFAASLAAQGIIKDLTNGFLILAEDQYAIGDIITIGAVGGAVGGIVENLTLRVTQVRDDKGRFITIPNSQISVVQNLTRAWSRVDFTVEIAYDSDLDRAIEVISEAAQELYRDPEWEPLIVEPPDVLGVESLSFAGVAIRVWIVTLPLQQFPVGREFNRRVVLALHGHGIQIGMPQQIVRAEAASSEAAAAAPRAATG